MVKSAERGRRACELGDPPSTSSDLIPLDLDEDTCHCNETHQDVRLDLPFEENSIDCTDKIL
jgi:hypothetical protein